MDENMDPGQASGLKIKRPLLHVTTARSGFLLSSLAFMGFCLTILSYLAIYGILLVASGSVYPCNQSRRTTGVGRNHLDDIDCGEVGFPGKYIPVERQYHHARSLDSTSEKAHKYSNQSCKSKNHQLCFWKSNYSPAPAFLSALRIYEKDHAMCVNGHPLTDFAANGIVPPGCRYLLWRDVDGKGNQLISLVSAFVYAMLTDRVLLITRGAHIQHLMCEPFPGSSWVLPEGFPDDRIREAVETHGVFYDRALNFSRAGKRMEDIDVPHHLDAYLANWQKRADLKFFCPGEQKLLARIPWLFFRSNQYSVPGMYFVPAFRSKLNAWFPDRAVFLHAGRYLFSPQERIWKSIVHVYKSQMVDSDRRLAIQVRAWGNAYTPIISEHILACAVYSGLLPNKSLHGLESDNNGHPQRSDAATATSTTVSAGEKINLPRDSQGRISVLVTSLRREYADKLAEEFGNDSSTTRKVSVFSPSAEGEQRSGLLSHDRKVIADMWLLSFADDMISTPRSTFGYVAHGLAGIRPIVFNQYGLSKENVPNPPCWKTNLPGPCFIDHPADMVCPMDGPDNFIGAGEATVPEVKHCDLQWGVGVFEE